MGVFQPVHCAVTRHRRLILGGALVMIAGLVVVSRIWQGIAGAVGLCILSVGLLLLLAGLSTMRQERRPTLAVDPGGRFFGVPAGPSWVYLAVGWSCVIALRLLDVGPVSDSGLPDLLIVGGWLLIGALWLGNAWADYELQIRPEGLLACGAGIGSLRVPWWALTAGQPNRPPLGDDHLTLAYDRPDLVQRRGIYFRTRRVPIGGVHPWFIADVIRHYVGHPEHRLAIGTPTEYSRLLYQLHSDQRRR